MMNIRQLQNLLEAFSPEAEAVVAFVVPECTAQIFEIDAVVDHHGAAELNIHEEPIAAAPQNGPGAGFFASDALLDTLARLDAIYARHGLTAVEKERIWQAIAALCYEEVRSREGSFYEAVRALFTDQED
jgi:hypothetical protein